MIHTRHLRRVAVVAMTGLVGALLPLVLASAPAHAADGCLNEGVTGGTLGLGGTRCDDVTPPETTLGAVTPAPNAAGYINVDQVTIAFSGAHRDGDTDPISFECQFYNTPSAPSTWSSCTSPVSYDDLDDTTSVAYTFKVRAIDSADNGTDATAAPPFGSAPSTDLPDLDGTPATTTFSVDTTTPQTYIFNQPFDEERPDLPMVDTTSPQFRLAATEGASTFRCAIDGEAYPCAEGITTFANLTPGD
ncbi:MAG: hypothetical protein F2667_05020, partial [Actinobacteria bacterium]|nr:hypothetical protein [Actinomycetota bacterium]